MNLVGGDLGIVMGHQDRIRARGGLRNTPAAKVHLILGVQAKGASIPAIAALKLDPVPVGKLFGCVEGCAAYHQKLRGVIRRRYAS